MAEPNITQHDLNNRFAYHPPKDEETKRFHELVREAMQAAAEVMVAITPRGREQSLAIAKLEEAMYWANAAIARQG